MIPEHVIVGGIVFALCTLLFFNGDWFLRRTAKGQRLVEWFGAEKEPWVLKGLTALGMLFGALLAARIIRPIQW